MSSTGRKITISGKKYTVYEGNRGGLFHKKGGTKTYLTAAQKKEYKRGRKSSGKRSGGRTKSRSPSPSRRVRSPRRGKKSSGRGCVKQYTKKYTERNSPPYPANECCGSVKKGNDGKWYESRPDKNGICRWYKYN